jgi:hypothetical protein
MSGTNRPTPEFVWIGERSEYETTDFDGRVRRGEVIGRLEPLADPTVGRNYLFLRLDPPLRLAGRDHRDVVITERFEGDSLLGLGDGSISVHLLAIEDREAIDRGIFEPMSASPLALADVAADPANLPESQEEQWNRMYEGLTEFARRAGHVRVPPGEDQDGRSLSVWVQNQKRSRQTGHLRSEWAARLEVLPGWEWYATDEFALLEDFARREGHTDVPVELVVDDRPLGQWLMHVRSSHSHLPADWVARLEAIPHWHW